MVHTLPDQNGRVHVAPNKHRMNSGCYNFSIDQNVTVTPEAADPVIVQPLSWIVIPDQVGIECLGENGQRNYWLVAINQGEMV